MINTVRTTKYQGLQNGGMKRETKIILDRGDNKIRDDRINNEVQQETRKTTKKASFIKL